MLYKLPLDLSTFAKLRTLNYVYVDKTEYMYNMITGGHRFFLSRPRRFGKSLLVSTLKEILTGNKTLFNGLWIEKSDYTWQEHGIITLDLSILGIDSIHTLKSGPKYALLRICEDYNLTIDTTPTEPEIILYNVAKALYKRFGHVAILIDEYDNPILRSLNHPENAQAIRDGLCQFFTAIKGLDAEVDFVFITGVSSFTKAGLFSGINNLQILTLNEKYSGICGYTDQEVNHYFNDHIHAWADKEKVSYDKLRHQIKAWYNGYHFNYNTSSVYNPSSLMNALHAQSFENFWFQSGTPKFLVDVLKKEYYSFDPERLETSKDSLGIFDINATPLVTLMFQTGYLTIVGYDKESQQYTLDYPNLEVKVAFQKYLLEVFTRLDLIKVQNLAQDLRVAFNNESIEMKVSKKLFP